MGFESNQRAMSVEHAFKSLAFPSPESPLNPFKMGSNPTPSANFLNDYNGIIFARAFCGQKETRRSGFLVAASQHFFLPLPIAISGWLSEMVVCGRC